MKRIAVILGVAAAVGVLAPTATAAKGRSDQPVLKPAAVELVLHTAKNSRSGQTMYRLGNRGLWME